MRPGKAKLGRAMNRNMDMNLNMMNVMNFRHPKTLRKHEINVIIPKLPYSEALSPKSFLRNLMKSWS